MKKIIAALLVLIFVLFFFWLQSPRTYQLQVNNQSSQTVDLFQLFGSGVTLPAMVEQIKADDSALLTVELLQSGELRFESVSGLNRIDTLIVDDVDELESDRQNLTISNGNRFVFSNL